MVLARLDGDVRNSRVDWSGYLDLGGFPQRHVGNGLHTGLNLNAGMGDGVGQVGERAAERRSAADAQ